MGVLLLIVANFLTLTTGPIGIVYTILKFIYRNSLSKLDQYFLQMAVSIDQTGNVIMQHIFNKILITKKSNNLFGNEDETISSVIGKNAETNTLSSFGKLLNNILDSIDPGHSLRSIERWIKIKEKINN